MRLFEHEISHVGVDNRRMNDWTCGYLTDIGYTFGYCTDLNPLRLAPALLHAGVAPPTVTHACELGFGQGLSVNLHAAASTVRWCGTDFNPAHAAFAQQLAEASGAQARLFDDSFAEFAQRGDLPEFDFIGLHGVWSWISDENRAAVVDFVRRKLKVGGVLQLSYNALPGWAGMVPMRHLMTEHARVLGAEGQGVASRIDAAIEFMHKVWGTKPDFEKAYPQAGERLQDITGKSRDYLAHEYFNRDWHPMHVATVARWLAPAKLQYACSSRLLDHVDEFNLGAEQQNLLAELPDPMFLETVRDFMLNRAFRSDLWVKGARPLAPLAQAELQRELRLVLVSPRSAVTLKVVGPRGEGMMSAAVHEPLLDLMADHQPRTLGQIWLALKGQGFPFAQLLKAVVFQLGLGHLAPVHDDATTSRVRPCTERLNAHLLRRARDSQQVGHLASPLTGGGTALDRIQQLLLAEHRSGVGQPREAAARVWKLLRAQGQSILKDGQALATPEENLAELETRAKAFRDTTLPWLAALGVA